MVRRRKTYSAEGKFGRAAEGFTQVPNVLLDNLDKLGLNHSETLVLLVLLRYWYQKEKSPTVAVATIANTVSLSVRQTQRILSALETKPVNIDGWDGPDGYIERVARRESRHGEVSQNSNRYLLRKLVRVLEHMTPEWA